MSRSDLIGHLFFLFSFNFQPHDSDLRTSVALVPMLGLSDRLAVDRVGVFFGIWNNTYRYTFLE
jgi:hypothetical protein